MKTLAQSLYGERVRSQHLYQLVTYLQHERRRQEHKGLCGLLIYPEVGQSLRLRYRLLDLPVLVATIDLGREWHDIEKELHDLLDDCASAARLTSGREVRPDEVRV
jgi:5-methylcytosine-specific restriction enzyme subunit McrC